MVATTEALLEPVARIEPMLREHAAEAESRRRLPDAAAAAMKGAGLYGMWTPRAYGGLEVDPMTALRILEEVARIDSAAAWNLAIHIDTALFTVYLGEKGASEIYGGGDSVLASPLFPPAEAVPVEGGFRVNGRASFASGCHHCDWILLTALIVEHGTARAGANGQPEVWFVALPSSDLEIVENSWNTVGMRGTGSNDVTAQDAFVPRHRAGPLVPPESRPNLPKGFEGPLYRCTVWPAVAALASIALGVARAAIDELVALVTKKTPAYTASSLSQRPVAQTQAAQAEAKLGAARAYVYEALREVFENAVAGQFVGMQHKLKVELAAIHAAIAAAEAVDLVHAAAGSSGIREERSFERHFRDVHVITQHAYFSASRYESVGKLMFGLESDWGFFAL
jgi:alkylation response protein AidB-like acyl-CoA dehydrogenase